VWVVDRGHRSDLVINVAALVVVQRAPQETSTEIFVGAFVVTLVLNGLLVYGALLPLRTRVVVHDVEAF
jgi:hypothetical protein